MRLIDFKLSTVDLATTTPLYWEVDRDTVYPIKTISLAPDQLILVPAKQTTALTLDQLNARTRQLDGHTALMVATPTGSQSLFGYRLRTGQLLFG
ncbi:hypothetical protein [Lactiplantibacillus plajomi]|uniref:Uncharacterized protein n=1 Tax=Lactiplantibacillus plajomi TaxID=1457217 RepID=A0ABV6K229_9LACO|nr:hypothetical protein [Lactiplantibacillus plajomi]